MLFYAFKSSFLAIFSLEPLWQSHELSSTVLSVTFSEESEFQSASAFAWSYTVNVRPGQLHKSVLFSAALPHSHHWLIHSSKTHWELRARLCATQCILASPSLENPMDGGAWKAAVHGVTEGQTRLSNFPFTFHFHALEKEMATHSSVLAWRIPGIGEPGGLLSMGSHRIRHDWRDLAAAAAASFIQALFSFME